MGEWLSGIVQLLSGILHPSEFHDAWDLSVPIQSILPQDIVGSVQSNLTSIGGTAVHRERRKLLPVSSRSEDISRTAWIHSVIPFFSLFNYEIPWSVSLGQPVVDEVSKLVLWVPFISGKSWPPPYSMTFVGHPCFYLSLSLNPAHYLLMLWIHLIVKNPHQISSSSLNTEKWLNDYSVRSLVIEAATGNLNFVNAGGSCRQNWY